MKRSSFITWDQLKVGGIILAALAVLAVAIYKLGQAANLFSKRYELVAFLPERERTARRRHGARRRAVRRDDSVDRLPARRQRHDEEPEGAHGDRRGAAGTDSRRLEGQGAHDGAARRQGDRHLDRHAEARRAASRATRSASSPSLDYEAVLAQVAGAVDDMVGLTHDMRKITGGIVDGRGTIGQLMTNRALYDQFLGTMRPREQHAGAIRESAWQPRRCCSTTRRSTTGSSRS